MIGGIPFALARARAAAAPLVTLALVAALAALLIVGVAGLVASAETREARAALAAATGDRAQAVLTLDEEVSPDAAAAAAAQELTALGTGEALVVSVEDGDVVLRPDLGRITAVDALTLADALPGVRDGVEEATGERPQLSGRLQDTLGEVRAGLDVRRGPTAVALGLLALLTAVVVGAVALEPVRARETETRLLRARGARPRDVIWLSLVEAFVVALVGAAAGAALGALAVAAFTTAVVSLAVGLAAVAGVAVAAALTAATGTARGTDRAASRARAVADTGAIVLLAVITGLAVWQFVQAGTPMVARGDGSAILDPLVALAPALALALAALVAVALATPLARGIAAALRPSRGVSPVTPLRLASRRPGRHALSITVVAFAIGSITVAAAYASSLVALGDAPEALRVGADVKVGTIPDDVEAADVAAAASPEAAMLARPLSAQGADGRIPILAVESARLGEVMRDAEGTIDPAGMAAALAVPAPQRVLAGNTLAMTLLAPAAPPMEHNGEVFEPGVPAFQVRVTVAGASGALETFFFSNADFVEVEVEDDNGNPYTEPDVRAEETVVLDLPPGDRWALAGIAVAYHPLSYAPGTAEITAVTSGGERVDLSGFRPAAGTAGDVEVSEDALLFAPEAAARQPSTRVVSSAVPATVPAVITAQLAASMSLTVGDTIALELIKPEFEADFEIVEVVPVLPGTASGEGMLVDLGALSLASPFEIAPSQAWLSTGDPGAAAAAVAAAFPQTAVTVADPRSAQNAAGTAWAFILAAGGAVVLAIAVLVLRRTRSRADSRELALLAVMGLGRRRASRLRAQEDLFAVAMGVLGGIAAGAFTAWLVVAPLVRAAYGDVPEAYPVPLRVEPLALTAAVVVVVALFCLIVSSVRAPSRLAGLLREDE